MLQTRANIEAQRVATSTRLPKADTPLHPPVQRYVQAHEALASFAHSDDSIPVRARHFAQAVTREVTAHMNRNHDDATTLELKEQIKSWVRNIASYETIEAMQDMRAEVNRLILQIHDHCHDINPDHKPHLDIPGAMIGNEFTFVNDQFILLDGIYTGRALDEQQIKKRNKDQKEKYDDIATAWNEVMSGYGFPGTPFVGNNDEQAYRFSIDLGYAIGAFQYDVTMDDLCVEVITTKTAAADLESGEIANAMDTYIFGVAAALDLRPHARLGGGHINIDRYTGFENNGNSLADFILRFMADKDYWKALDEDAPNAAFPDETGREAELEAVIEEHREALDGGEDRSNADLANQIIARVYDAVHPDIADNPELTPELYSHYQALNLDHFSASDIDERRVEVRRVRAQASRVELLNDLDRIFKLITRQDPPAQQRFN